MKQYLINLLQKQIKSRSINSLGNLLPDDISEWLGIEGEELLGFIDDLHEKRILLYKYRLQCSCGEMCVIYENRLVRDKVFNCEVCGKEFSLKDIRENSSIIYEIDKRELLAMTDAKVNFKVIPIVNHSEVGTLKKEEEKQGMEIFIGSSSEAAGYMVEIAAILEQFETKPLMWNAPGKNIFVPGTNTIDALIEITERVQAAIFIFNADDVTWNSESAIMPLSSVRDNVLFEYGLFMGALGKKNICFVCKGKPKLATDLNGITYIDADLGEAQVTLKLRDWIAGIKK